MSHTVHNLVQGCPEWHAFRAQHHGASEAAAMLGMSTKMTRTELLNAKHTGIAREFSDFVQERILDKGHEVEALARPIIEKIIGEALYPVTCSKGKLSASCDGLTMGDDKAFEHKQWNESLAAAVRAKQLPDSHMPQCQQIMMVTDADVVIFVVSDGTPDRMEYMEVFPDQAWQDRIAAGWGQFESDLAEFVPPIPAKLLVAAQVEALPAVVVTVAGTIAISDNFAKFEVAIHDFLENRLIRKPKTDQDFVDLDNQIKAMKAAEVALDGAEANWIAQIDPISKAKSTKDMLKKLVTENRLMAEKLLESEKVRRKGEIVAEGMSKLKEHLDMLNTRLGKIYMPTIRADFGAAIKGMRSLANMEDAIATTLANAKIEANEAADRIQANLATLRELAGAHAFLFADTGTIVLKAPDDLLALVKSRIADHQAAEAEKEEATRARIRTEEQAKAQKEVDDRAAEAAKKAESERLELEQKAAQALAESAPVAIKEVSKLVVDEPIISTGSRVVVPMTKPVPSAAPTLRLGVINERLAPIVLTSDGLASLGFPFVAMDKAAKLYNESDFGLICAALVNRINQVQVKLAA